MNHRAAWVLFGSVECIGLYIRIGDLGYRVCAVVEWEEETQAAFVPLRSADITFMEAMLPEWTNGSAGKKMTQNAPEGVVINWSERFQIGSLVQKVQNGYNGVFPPPVAVPIWEQQAQQRENQLCIWWISLAFGMVGLLILILPGIPQYLLHRRKSVDWQPALPY